MSSVDREGATTLLVTGGGSGIGRALAIRAAEDGWKIAITDIDLGAAESVAAESVAAGAAAAVGIRCDVRSEEAVAAAFDRASDELGLPTAVAANAGIEISTAAHETSVSDWSRVIETNLTGAFLTCREAIRRLTAAGVGGSVVCTSSPSASVGFAGGRNSAYGSSKGGVSALVRALAVEYASVGIRVNAIVPGATDTPLLYFGASPVEQEALRETFRRNAREQVPLQRMADPAEIAEAMFWLLSPRSSYVTGTELFCDGGLTARGSNTF